MKASSYYLCPSCSVKWLLVDSHRGGILTDRRGKRNIKNVNLERKWNAPKWNKMVLV